MNGNLRITQASDIRTLTQCPMRQGNNWGTGCILMDSQNRVLVGKRTDTHNYCTPGGKVEVGETVIEGMQREVKEEANVSLQNFTFYHASVGAYHNNKVWISYMFLSKDFEGEIKPQLSEIECWEWLTIPEVKCLDLFPPTKHALEVAGKLGLIEY